MSHHVSQSSALFTHLFRARLWDLYVVMYRLISFCAFHCAYR